MRKTAGCIAAVLFLSGCGTKIPESTVPPSTNMTYAVQSNLTDTMPVSSQISHTSGTVISSESAEENVAHTTVSSESKLTTVSSSITTLAQGGQGGEDHASDPDPDYFTYRFFPESVSMRLAGGNYQTVFYDFAEAVDHEVDSLFYLADFNFDGKSDLSVPVRFADNNITYAVFIWNSETSLFETEPVLLCNPSVDKKSKNVVCLSFSPDNGAEKKLQFLYWNHDEPVEIRTVTADYKALTLTDAESDAVQTSQFESEEALREALIALLPEE